MMDLGDYLLALWRRRLVLVAIVVVCVVIGLLASRGTSTYQASVRLIATRPKFDITTQGGNNAYVISVIRSRAVVDKVIAEFGFDRDPMHMTADEFVLSHLTIEPREAHYLVTLRLPTPQVDKIANRLVQRARDRFFELGRPELVSAVERAREQQKVAGQTLDDVASRLDAKTRDAATVAADSIHLMARRTRRAELPIEIEVARAMLANSDTDSAPRSDVSMMRMKLAGLLREQQVLQQSVGADQAASRGLAVEQEAMRRLKLDQKRVQARADEADRLVTQAESQLAQNGPSVEVIDPAGPPPGPLTFTGRNVVVAVTLGVLLFAVAVPLAEVVRDRRNRQRAAAPPPALNL